MLSRVLPSLSTLTCVIHLNQRRIICEDAETMSHSNQLRGGTLIVKFGGSAITHKQEFETLKAKELMEAAFDIREAHKRGAWSRIILVHGAGSFGHFQAREYGLKNGRTLSCTETIADPNSWQAGLALTRQSVLKLNQTVVASHIAVGLPAVSISPFPSVITGIRDGAAQRKEPSINPKGSTVLQTGILEQVLEVCQAGLLPIIHGDIVLDNHQKCAVFGGDHIITWLCRHMSSSPLCSATAANTAVKATPASAPQVPERIRVVFLTDVAGVYDQAPHHPGAQLIRRIRVHPDGTTNIRASTETAAHDVTGGIEAKLKAAIAMALLGPHVEVMVVQIDTPSATQALGGKVPDTCTIISMDGECQQQNEYKA